MRNVLKINDLSKWPIIAKFRAKRRLGRKKPILRRPFVKYYHNAGAGTRPGRRYLAVVTSLDGRLSALQPFLTAVTKYVATDFAVAWVS